MAHLLHRVIQVVLADNGQVRVFRGDGHAENLNQNPLVLVHGDNHYQVIICHQVSCEFDHYVSGMLNSDCTGSFWLFAQVLNDHSRFW